LSLKVITILQGKLECQLERKKKRKATYCAWQAVRRSLHQLRKRRHNEKDIVGIWRVDGRPLLQTKALRAIFFQVHVLSIC